MAVSMMSLSLAIVVVFFAKTMMVPLIMAGYAPGCDLYRNPGERRARGRTGSCPRLTTLRFIHFRAAFMPNRHFPA